MEEKKNYYETDRANFLFAAGMIAALLAAVVIALGFLQDPVALLPSIPFVVYIVAAFIYHQAERKSTCADLEKLTALMRMVAEDETMQPEIEYKQGQMGLVFTDFQKLSAVLQSTRTVAHQDKKLLKDTISDISHQLKTPLASLKLFIELLSNSGITEERRTSLLAEAGNQIERMEWLILALLKQARIEAGAVAFEKTDCDLGRIIDDAVSTVAYLTEPRKQHVKLKLSTKDGEKVVFRGDGPWLTEALSNLLKNASDYSEEGTEILVQAEENELFTRVSVTDYGKGIPEKDLDHIFDRFYRVDKSVNPNSVGIGLSLAKTITEGMDGQITVRSKEGEYTCFRLTFVKGEMR
ncbi:MAG: HAMP domain-containing histidine kinase [Acetatifactor sp.]|nr:HAMP domain-containing histidine kinase [Acetatifactor sp.]